MFDNCKTKTRSYEKSSKREKTGVLKRCAAGAVLKGTKIGGGSWQCDETKHEIPTKVTLDLT